MNEILNQLLTDVEKHGIQLVRDHLLHYEKQLNEVKSKSILQDYPKTYIELLGKPNTNTTY